MKNLLYIVALFLITNVSGQVGIGTTMPNSKAVLELTSSNKGFLPAKVPLIATTNPEPVGTNTNPPIEGLLVFNTINVNDVVRGYYIWQNSKWELIGSTSVEVVVDQLPDYAIDYLGYQPVGVANDPNNSTLTYAGITLNKKGNCVKWEISNGGNDHVYCAYDTTGAMNWAQAFNLAKLSKGYLVTITSDAEWAFLKDKIIEPNSLNNHIWMGFNKIISPGNNARLEWITGENSVVNQTNSATIQHHFAGGQPDNSTGVEGCAHIFSVQRSPTREWNDFVCNQSQIDGLNFNQLIIEFLQ